MKKKFYLLFCFILEISNLSIAQTLNNPIVPIYDGCIERFMGKYYAMGTGTLGKIYASKDLINWEEPVLAAKTDEATWLNDPQWNQREVYNRIGAGDILYRNGVFHIYFNGIGHSYSDNPLGMYKEQSINEPFDDYGIDVQVFQDEDGSIYYVKKVNPGDPHPITGDKYPKSGPEIWVFNMNSPFIRKGIDGNVQMTHQIGHPTNIDLYNFEGPELFKYRDNYYIMFSPNRMSARTGMYEIGVAQSNKPNNFSNSKKYPHPILTRNTEEHLVIYKQILNSGEHGPWDAKYTTLKPSGLWYEFTYDDSLWKNGKGGFGLKNKDLAIIRSNRTIWNTNEIYIRRKFNLDKIPENIALKYRVEANTIFYINGNKLVIDKSSTAYSLIDIDRAWFKEGDNIIAVEAQNNCTGTECFKFVDFGLFDTGKHKAEKIVIGQSQSNFVLGPGGFERWIMYKAFFNGVSSQGIDRIHFYDKEIVCEQSVTANTQGYHPTPAKPTYISYFDYNLYYSFEFLNNSSWQIKNKELQPKENKLSSLLLRTKEMTNYRFEVPFKIKKGNNDQASIYAWYKDESNYLKVTICRDENIWKYEINKNGSIQTKEYTLPEKFKFIEDNELVSTYEEPWHTITIYKNGGNFKIELDYFNLTLDNQIETEFIDKGRIGIEATSNNVSFDAIQYTIGFDEWDKNIKGWKCNNEWSVDVDGIKSSPKGVCECFKGDFLTDYEFSTFVKNDNIPTNGKNGFYPIYIDKDNYVKVYIDYNKKIFELEQKNKGQIVKLETFTLNRNTSRQYTYEKYPTTTYRYDFRTETEISGLDVLWFEGNYPYLKQTFDLPENVEFYALSNTNIWTKINSELEGEPCFAKLNHYNFDNVTTKSIKIEVTPKAGKAARAFSAFFNEKIAAGYYLRARREFNKLYVFINDKLAFELSDDWAPSIIGLYTENLQSSYNGNLYYQTGQIPVDKIEITSNDCKVGETIELKANIYPDNATNKILVWNSSNPSIASIEGNRLTRHKEGKVKITAWPADGSIKFASINLGETTDINTNLCEIKLYPNPTKDIIHIESKENIECIELYSITGVKIKNIKPKNDCISYCINLDNLADNFYYIRIKTKNNIITNKIIKK